MTAEPREHWDTRISGASTQAKVLLRPLPRDRATTLLATTGKSAIQRSSRLLNKIAQPNRGGRATNRGSTTASTSTVACCSRWKDQERNARPESACRRNSLPTGEPAWKSVERNIRVAGGHARPRPRNRLDRVGLIVVPHLSEGIIGQLKDQAILKRDSGQVEPAILYS